VKVIPEAIPADGSIEEFGCVLGSAGAQAVEAQGIFVVLAVFAVLATGIQLTEHQLPVVTLFLFVVVHRAATAEVLHFHGVIFIPGDDDGIAVTLTGFVDGVTEDLKHGVLAALQVVGAENDGGALANTLLAFEHGNAGISVLFLSFCSHKCYLPYLSILTSLLYAIFAGKSNSSL
jgi:hypothetical protein